MIKAKEFKAFLKAAIYLAAIEDKFKVHNFQTKLIVFELGKYLTIKACDEHCLIVCEFLKSEAGAGKIALSIDQCKDILKILNINDDISVIIAADKLFITQGFRVFDYSGSIDFKYPNFETILNGIHTDKPQGYRAWLDLKYFSILQDVGPVVDNQIEFYIKGKELPFLITATTETLHFNQVVMPLATA